jgi:hypothetical protein
MSLLKCWLDSEVHSNLKGSGTMRFERLASQSEIDIQLQRSKPRLGIANPLPWGPALIGLSLMVIMQTLL